MDNELNVLAARLGQVLTSTGKIFATAESCTGGWIAQAVTAIPGSSAWFDRGFVTYSNMAKMQMLDVKQATLDQHGAVSAETVKEMVTGALRHSVADCALAVSGIAGPDGGSEQKPVGTVFIAWSHRGKQPLVVQFLFSGDRQSVRKQAVEHALKRACEQFSE